MKKLFKIPTPVLEILKTLKQNHFEGYVVGGAIRDLLLKKNPKDWDIATNAKPNQVEKIFSNTVATGKKYGMITVFHKKIGVQVTTYREESEYEKNRKPKKVKFVRNLNEDLSRRDFTVNAMAFDPFENVLIDPFNGKKDLKKKILRSVGEGRIRFKEDALRMIRAGRFLSQLQFKPDPFISKAAKKNSKDVEALSGERIRDEILKLLMTPKPEIGFVWMEKVGVLRGFLPELSNCVGVDQKGWHQFDVFMHTLKCLEKSVQSPRVRLTLLLHDIAKPLTRTKEGDRYHFYGHADLGAKMSIEIMSRLRFSKEMIQSVSHLVKHHLFEEDSVLNSDAAVRRFIQRIGDDRVDDLLEVRAGDAYGCGKGHSPGPSLSRLKRKIEKIRKQKTVLSIHDLAINGYDVMNALKIPPGPKVGQILQKLHDMVLQDPIINTRNYLIKTIYTLQN